MQLVTWHTEHLDILQQTDCMQPAACIMQVSVHHAASSVQQAACVDSSLLTRLGAPSACTRLGHSARTRLIPTDIRMLSLMQDGRQRDDLKQEWRIRHGSGVREPW